MSYFSMPVFYNKDETKDFLKNQILNIYEIEIKFNEKNKLWFITKTSFFTQKI